MNKGNKENQREFSSADLRGILKYVPQWRNHIFVIAIDGSVVDTDNFSNLMLEIAVLRNLGIKVIIVYGIGAQLSSLANTKKVKLSDNKGAGPTDDQTLTLAIEAAQIVGHKIEKGITQNQLKGARVNSIRSTERGILKGKNQIYTGKVDKIDTALLQHLMDIELIPVISPIAFNRDGQELRINSDMLASDLAVALKASKLIYLLPHAGLTYNGELQLNVAVQDLSKILDKNSKILDEAIRSKANYAVQTIKGGTPRAHIIDSRIQDGLLMEVFSKVGIGSMIHSNPYAQIRAAKKKDVQSIYNLTKAGVKDETLKARTRLSIEKSITDYYVYEIDDSAIGCFRLSRFNRSKVLELGSLFIHPAYKGRNIGKYLVDYAIDLAKEASAPKLLALTTQAIAFFSDTCGFQSGSLSDLPKELKESYQQNGRNSKIFIYPIKNN